MRVCVFWGGGPCGRLLSCCRMWETCRCINARCRVRGGADAATGRLIPPRVSPPSSPPLGARIAAGGRTRDAWWSRPMLSDRRGGGLCPGNRPFVGRRDARYGWDAEGCLGSGRRCKHNPWGRGGDVRTRQRSWRRLPPIAWGLPCRMDSTRVTNPQSHQTELQGVEHG